MKAFGVPAPRKSSREFLLKAVGHHLQARVYGDLKPATLAFYLLSHGIVKLFLVAGLLRNRAWAYPASLIVLGLFIAYQVYRFALTQSFGLVVLTIFDLLVVVLIWHEYRLIRKHLPRQ